MWLSICLGLNRLVVEWFVDQYAEWRCMAVAIFFLETLTISIPKYADILVFRGFQRVNIDVDRLGATGPIFNKETE